jgi:hypothetical protein
MQKPAGLLSEVSLIRLLKIRDLVSGQRQKKENAINPSFVQ